MPESGETAMDLGGLCMQRVKKMKKVMPQKSRTTNSYMLLTISMLVVVTTIISVFCFYTYGRVQSRLKEIAITESKQVLDLSTDTVSTSFQNVWEVFTDSQVFYKISSTVTDGMKNREVSNGALLSVHKELKSHFYVYDYIQDVSVFITTGKKDYWCTTKIVSDDFRRDYENGFYSFDELPYDTFRDMILNSEDNRVVPQDFYVGRVKSSYSYKYDSQIIYLTYPVRENRDDLQIFAIMQINLDSIREKMSAFQYCGSSFSLYANDQLLYSTEPDGELTGAARKAYFESSTDPYYVKSFIGGLGLTCYTSLDSDSMYQGIAPFTQLLAILIFIMVSAMAVFIIFLFRYWLIPISQAADALPAGNHKGSPVEKIKNHLDEMNVQNSTIQNELFQYQKNEALKKIYRGRIHSRLEEPVLSELAPARENNYRCVYIGRISAVENQPVPVERIFQKIRASSVAMAAPTVIDDIVTCLVIQPDNHVYADSHAFFGELNALLTEINDENSQFAIGISDVYTGINSIPYAWQQAENSWQSALAWQNSSVVCNTALFQATDSYFVSYNLLESMYQAIISNRKETALKIYDQLVEDNFGEKADRLSILYYQQFIDDIMGVLIRVSTEFDIHAIIESFLSMNKKTGLKKKIELLRSAIVEICEFIPIHDYNSELINEILAYCTEHYNDYQLSLSLLAEQFHLSRSSISKYFKANLGINFSAYIEKLRLTQAKKLILENTLPVKKIAEMVGYQNITTFYNAFRKAENCTPMEWRQKQANAGEKAQSE